MLLWCGSCTRRRPAARQEDSVSCSICGKVLNTMSWHTRFDTRNQRFKRIRGRRRHVQINDNESCVTNQEISVNIDDALSSTAEKPVVVKVKDRDDDLSSTAEKPVFEEEDSLADSWQERRRC
ncbi:hypothetical protein SADUNF_Sadunf09G0126000 [Salix dunnii]|uniref:Uncharacterized protein n=1 Tax=Salix dunnii TaxID=1413687 RepID=A0A835JYQ2_9ROSI|nr:hypothetical protein SADUNF_Sadunf09G0126000 [Salix dunnii]